MQIWKLLSHIDFMIWGQSKYQLLVFLLLILETWCKYICNSRHSIHDTQLLDRFASPLAVRPKEASDGFHTIGDVMPLTASAHVMACATTSLPFHPMFPIEEVIRAQRGETGPRTSLAFCTTKRRSIPDLFHVVPRISTSFRSVCFAPSCSAKGSFRWFSHHRGVMPLTASAHVMACTTTQLDMNGKWKDFRYFQERVSLNVFYTRCLFAWTTNLFYPMFGCNSAFPQAMKARGLVYVQ